MSFPSRLLLADLIKRLQAFDSGFNLYSHEKIANRWDISYTVDREIEKSYPLKASRGQNHTYIDSARLKKIASHFNVPDEIFSLTPKEIKKGKSVRSPKK